MIKFDTSELDRLKKNLEQLEDGIQVSTNDLFTDAFVRQHSRFSTWQEMMDAGGISADEDIQSEWFSEFVRQNSDFESFDAMVEKASAEFVARTLDS